MKKLAVLLVFTGFLLIQGIGTSYAKEKATEKEKATNELGLPDLFGDVGAEMDKQLKKVKLDNAAQDMLNDITDTVNDVLPGPFEGPSWSNPLGDPEWWLMNTMGVGQPLNEAHKTLNELNEALQSLNEKTEVEGKDVEGKEAKGLYKIGTQLQGIMHSAWLIIDLYFLTVGMELKVLHWQVTSTGLYHLFVLGQFFDAEQQLAGQRLLQKLMAEATKDYHPSVAMCKMGTTVRSLAEADRTVTTESYVLAQRALKRDLGQYLTAASAGETEYLAGRLRQFKSSYCSKYDNNYIKPGAGQAEDTGLSVICQTNEAAGHPAVFGALNSDVNVAENILLNPHVTRSTAVAVGSNLYGNKVPSRPRRYELKDQSAQELYMAMRSVIAKRSVAEYSYNKIAAMKAPGLGEKAARAGNIAQAYPYMAVLLNEMGMSGEDKERLGYMSYLTQMEFLTKKMFQRPGFYTDLYDKPVNVRRMSVALKGLNLMLDRDMYESYLRSEMLMSILLEIKTIRKQQDVQNDMRNQRPGG